MITSQRIHRLRRGLALPLALILALLLPLGAWATSYHAITVDGTIDEWDDATERMATSSGDSVYGYITWDADSLYVAWPQVDFDGYNQACYIAVDTDPHTDPDTGNGATDLGYEQWLKGSTVILPFNADILFMVKENNAALEEHTFHYTNGAWEMDGTNGSTDYRGAFGHTYGNESGGNLDLEFSINRAAIDKAANGDAVYMVAYCKNLDDNEGWGYLHRAMPGADVTDGWNDKTFTHHLGYVLVPGIAPNAAAHLDCAPAPVVTSTADSGAGSLRQALAAACPGATVTFSDTLAGETITLASTLAITRNLSLDGSALVTPVTLSGNDAVRVFKVTNNARVTLERLAVVHGLDTSTECIGVSCGSGLYNDSGIVAMHAMTFTDHAGGRGAAIYNAAGAVNISDSFISDNATTVGGGGGIANYATLIVAGSTISNNTTPSGGLQGGGIFNASAATLTATHTTFQNNAPTGAGGGVANQGTVALANCLFIGNSTPSTIGGGGVYNSGNMTLETSTFSENSAMNRGGAIYHSEGKLSVTNSIFSNNTAGGNGGAINNWNGTLAVANSTFTTNSAANGGALVNYGYNTNPFDVISATTTISNSTFSDLNTASAYGGAIYNLARNASSAVVTATLTLVNSTIVGNIAQDGGGGASHVEGTGPVTATLTMKNSIVYSNTATGTGPNCADPDATLVGNANNLFHSTANGCPLGTADVATDTAVETIMSALADNGGPTPTRALVAGSPALDAGDNTVCPATDQRSLARLSGTACDIGAYEAMVELGLTKTVTPTIDVAHHGLLTYTVALNNGGVLSDTQFFFTDTLATLPVAFAGWIVSPPHTLLSNGEITWSGTVTAGEAITWTWAVTHTGDYAETITNTAHFSGTLQAGQAQAGFNVEANYAPALGAIGDKTVDELAELTFTATATDANVNDILTFTLDTGSAGSITTDGAYTWTPAEADGPGTYTATVRVSDGALDDTDTITITVNEINTAPALAAIGPKTVDELAELTFTATATDSDIPAQTLTFTLDTGSAGSITTDGAYTWTPAEADGPGTYTATVRVSDGALDDVETITITVTEINTAPALAAIGPKTVDELSELTFTATATDSDIPAQTLTFTLDAGSAGDITPGGAYTWTPAEADGPGTYTATVRVSDGVLDDVETITITVNEVNQAPTADAGADRYTTLGKVVTLDGSGSSDLDTGDSLTYSWIQTGGPAITLSNANTESPTFTASVTGTLTFQLTVTDTAPFGNGGVLSDSDTTVVTVTEQTYYALKLNLAGSGVITPGVGTHSYLSGTVVDLSANPAEGWQFDGWSGDLESTSNPAPVTMDADKVITATFSLIHSPTYTLTVHTVGQGTVTLDPPGGVYDAGTAVTLTATVDPGWYFGQWSGATTGILTQTTITLDTNKVVTATFIETPPTYYTLTLSIVGSGIITPAAGMHSYLSGTLVNLHAQPATGWQFDGWSGDLESTNNPAQVTMSTHKTVTATFSLSATTNHTPTADAGPNQNVTWGDVITLDGSGSSDPDAGDTLTYRWAQTGGDTVTLNDTTVVQPTFTATTTGTLTFTLTITDSGGLADSDSVSIIVTEKRYQTYLPLLLK